MKCKLIALLLFLSSCTVSSRLSKRSDNLLSQIQKESTTIDTLNRNGNIGYYSEDGKKEKIVKYKNNYKHGSYILFYPNGQIKELGKYKNDLLMGNNYQFFENGNSKRIAKLKNGEYNGKMTYFNDKGVKIGEGNCKDDIWDGKWVKYDDLGNVLTFLHYGSELKISDYKIKLTSQKYIWELFEKLDYENYSSVEIRCISKISSKKDLISDNPLIFIDFLTDPLSFDKLRIEDYKVDFELSVIEILDSDFSGYIDKNGDARKYLVFELKTKNTLFIINAYFSEENFYTHEDIIIDLVSNLSTY